MFWEIKDGHECSDLVMKMLYKQNLHNNYLPHKYHCLRVQAVGEGGLSISE